MNRRKLFKNMAALAVGSVIPNDLAINVPRLNRTVVSVAYNRDGYYTYMLYTSEEGMRIFEEAVEKERQKYENALLWGKRT